MVAISPLSRGIIPGTYTLKLNSTQKIVQTQREIPYFLAYFIYQNWPIFLKLIQSTESDAESIFKKMQEEVR